MQESQMRRGFRRAIEFKDTSANAVCIAAGKNRNLLNEYLRDPEKDMYIGTGIELCKHGLGMNLIDVWILGQME